jgi:hypothetical protein
MEIHLNIYEKHLNPISLRLNTTYAFRVDNFFLKLGFEKEVMPPHSRVVVGA